MNTMLAQPKDASCHSGIDAAAKKRRAGKPKVKTGCITCKIRKVKCDESKPDCFRCRSTGRRCDGYAEGLTALQLRKAPDVHMGTQAELRALEFFYTKKAPQLSSYFDAEFWSRMVFQMSHADESIRHAMVALSALAEQRDQTADPMTEIVAMVSNTTLGPSTPRKNLPAPHGNVTSNERFALAYYNKAISELGRKLQTSEAPIEHALLVCILFVCIEFLNGDQGPALDHFHSGMKIVASLSGGGSTAGTLTSRTIKDNILPVFYRLEILYTLFGFDADWEYHIALQDAIPTAFQDMRQARDSLVHLMNLGLRFIRSVKFSKYEGTISSNDMAKQKELQVQLANWQLAFDLLVLSVAGTPVDRDGESILQIQKAVASIWIDIAVLQGESTDAWNDQFEEVVKLAETIRLQDHAKLASNFLFDMEIVSPLWFVIARCRHPLTRRRAAAVLKRCTRREGLWDSRMAGAIAERIISIEEQNLSTMDGSELPAEKDRIHNTNIQSEPGMYPNRHVLTHFLRPQGLDGPWEIFHEEIYLVQNPGAL